MFMEISVVEKHPELKELDIRFIKTVDSVICSFRLEGIEFSPVELEEMISNVKEVLKI